MLSVIIDWLEFTILQAQLDAVIEILKLKIEDFSPLTKGRFGYHHQLKWNDGNIFIMFTSTNDRVDAEAKINEKSGIHVMITGQGCRQFSVNHNLKTLIIALSAHEHVNFTRIDLAIDDYDSKIINYTRIHDHALRGHFTSRWSKWDEINSRQTSDNKFLGRTMYFGSQQSDLFCRIYDKTLERKANADEEIDTEWTRLELVYRKERASMLVKYLVDGELSLGSLLKGTLKQYLRFLTPSRDSNKARWPTAPWWEQLLEEVAPLKLTIKKEARTIEDMTSWVEQQISPTIAAIIKAHEGDLSWLRSILYSGAERLTQKHTDAIRQYQKGLTA